MSQLRAAVFGAGMMGRNHIRLLGSMSDVTLCAIVDPDIDLAKSRISSPDTVAVASIDELPEIDIAVVATPTQYHYDTAMALMARGINVLVEKPLAPTAAQSLELAEAAAAAGVTLAVGHVERFNAALGMLAQLAQDPRMLLFERLSPYTPRILDSVVMDLMVHDLDLALAIVGDYPSRIEACGSVVFSDSIDFASAILEFPDGRVAAFQASRVTQDKVRRVTITEPERYIIADSIRQDVLIKRETSVDFTEDEGTPAYRQANVVEVPYLNRSGEPLERELRDFIDAVRNGTDPMVNGAAGAAAVRLAREVEARIAGV